MDRGCRRRRREAARVRSAAPSLPDEPAATPSGELAGTLRPSVGSFVGYRVDETLIGIGLNTAVGRTGQVNGSARIEGGRIVDARFSTHKRTLRSDEARRDEGTVRGAAARAVLVRGRYATAGQDTWRRGTPNPPLPGRR